MRSCRRGFTLATDDTEDRPQAGEHGIRTSHASIYTENSHRTGTAFELCESARRWYIFDWLFGTIHWFVTRDKQDLPDVCSGRDQQKVWTICDFVENVDMMAMIESKSAAAAKNVAVKLGHGTGEEIYKNE
jgi:hypothetical protein